MYVKGTAETEISPEVEDQIEQLEHKLRIATRKNNVKKVASLTKKLAALRAESLQQVKRLPVLLMNKDEWCTECSLSLEGGDLVHIKMQVRLRAGNDRSLLQLAESTTDCDLWYSSFELFDSKHRGTSSLARYGAVGLCLSHSVIARRDQAYRSDVPGQALPTSATNCTDDHCSAAATERG